MTKKNERNRIKDLGIVKKIREIFKGIKIPGYRDLSLYTLFKIYTSGLVKGALKSRAGSVAFSFFMAFFPFLLFMLNLIPFIPIDNLNETFSLFMESLMPDSSKGFFMSIYQDIQENQHGGLLSTSFLMSILFMGNGINSLFSAFQGSHHVTVSRPFIRKYFYSIFIGLLISILLMSAVIIYVLFEINILDSLSEQGIIKNDYSWLKIGEYVLLILMTILIPAILYFFGTPGGRKERFFSTGVFITAGMFILSTLLFGVYVNTFSSYNELYGSIGALLILMLYIWVNSVILLLGFELNMILNGLKKEVE